MLRPKVLFKFLILVIVKNIFRLFYRFDVPMKQMTSCEGRIDYSQVKMFIILNHTSLFEPVFLGSYSNRLLWQFAERFVFPVASKTMNNRLFNKIYSNMASKTISVSRKRDATWDHFLQQIDANSMVGIAPEGHMKRPNGLDSKGRPLVIRRGFIDVLEKIGDCKILVLYSHGLHHIQTPGEGFPKLFKRVSGRLELWSRDDFITSAITKHPEANTDDSLVKFLTSRRDLFCKSTENSGKQSSAEVITTVSTN